MVVVHALVEVLQLLYHRTIRRAFTVFVLVVTIRACTI